jgi:hypothetical protein
MKHRIRVLSFGLVAVASLASSSSADTVHLKTGGRLEGVVVSETASSLTIEMAMGQVSVPKSSVVRIERAATAAAEYRTRLSAIAPGDVNAFAELARFAGEHNLRKEARLAWMRVLSVDPGNAEAHLALGHVLVGNIYVDEDEAWRSRGYVFYDGRWMTPAEQAYLLHEREARAEDDRRASEARRVVREEEDRERRAEAAAERARAAAEETLGSGLPVWGYGGSILVGSPGWGGYTAGCVGVGCYRVPPMYGSRPQPPTPVPVPHAAPVRPSSLR